MMWLGGTVWTGIRNQTISTIKNHAHVEFGLNCLNIVFIGLVGLVLHERLDIGVCLV